MLRLLNYGPKSNIINAILKIVVHYKNNNNRPSYTHLQHIYNNTFFRFVAHLNIARLIIRANQAYGRMQTRHDNVPLLVLMSLRTKLYSFIYADRYISQTISH